MKAAFFILTTIIENINLIMRISMLFSKEKFDYSRYKPR